MTKFKIGDRVKCISCYQGHPVDSRYNLPRSSGTISESGNGYIIVDYDGKLSPPVNPNCFSIIDPAEEVISLLTSLGYTVKEPPAKRKGKGWVYSIGGSIIIYPYEQSGSYKPIAIVDWTEGDGI